MRNRVIRFLCPVLFLALYTAVSFAGGGGGGGGGGGASVPLDSYPQLSILLIGAAGAWLASRR